MLIKKQLKKLLNIRNLTTLLIVLGFSYYFATSGIFNYFYDRFDDNKIFFYLGFLGGLVFAVFRGRK